MKSWFQAHRFKKKKKKKKAAILSLKLPYPFVSAAAELAGGVLGSWSGLQAAWRRGCGRGGGLVPSGAPPGWQGARWGLFVQKRVGIVLTSLHSPPPLPSPRLPLLGVTIINKAFPTSCCRGKHFTRIAHDLARVLFVAPVGSDVEWAPRVPRIRIRTSNRFKIPPAFRESGIKEQVMLHRM